MEGTQYRRSLVSVGLHSKNNPDTTGSGECTPLQRQELCLALRLPLEGLKGPKSQISVSVPFVSRKGVSDNESLVNTDTPPIPLKNA